MVSPRTARMLGPDGPRGMGLEIGALHSPVVRKAEHQVLYVDYAPTEVVKANQFDPAVDRDAIVDVDIVWGDRPLREAVGRTVDYVVASHVIEHVPDLAGWLLELREVLRDGGTLGLAVPDKRFTFDALRRESTLAEVVEAYLLRFRRPSLRQVYDAAWLGVAVDGAEVWNGTFDLAKKRAEALARGVSALRLVEDIHARPRYNDAHCWVFTPASFASLMGELAQIGLFPFRIEQFHPTEVGGAEFHVRLTAAGPGDEAAVRASIDSAREAALRGPQPPGAAARPRVAEAPEPGLAAGPAQVLEAENAALRAELAVLRASTSWRVTAPLRAAKRLLGGG